jgi:hypothetical protein
VGFEDLAKIIGARWQTIDDGSKQYFKDLADRDRERYNIDLVLWRQQQSLALTQQQLHLERSVDQRTRKQYFEAAGSPAAHRSSSKIKVSAKKHPPAPSPREPY